MKCSDIMKQLEKLAPQELACEWDNVGLLLGRTDKNISKILIALELSEEVVDQAISSQADMIITHHPLIFKPLKRINSEDFIGRWILKLLRSDISYYAMHTNFDRSAQGMGVLAAEKLGLCGQRMLDETTSYRDGDGNEQTAGIGCFGNLPKAVTLEELCQRISKTFENEGIRVYAPADAKERMISEIAVVPGSGGDYVKVAAECGADVLITGDVSHHEGSDAVSQGMIVIDVGHYSLEYPFVEYMERYLTERVSAGIEIETVSYRSPYYQTGGMNDNNLLS
ncbi:MAG: Nif3-like dinuclear metal center hexameric protein [Lachnospiraceae bacterium]|nr:Nif3-like dinuclear metal center hexameric protein [Lachnospiraceae bacterium]